MKMIKLSFLFFELFLIAFPFGQLARLPLPLTVSALHLYATDVFLILALLFSMRRLIRSAMMFPKILWSLFLLYFLVFLSLLISFNSFSTVEVFTGFMYLVRWSIYLSLVFLIPIYIEEKFVSQQGLFFRLAGVGISVAVFGWIQYLIWPDLRLFEIFHWDPHYYRLVGSFLDPGFTGLICVLTLLLLLFLRDEKRNFLYNILLALAFFTMLFTYSRSSYLAFLTGLAFLAKLKNNWRIFIIGSIFLAVSVFFLPRPFGEGVRLERTSTIEARWKNWSQSIQIIKRRPFLGVGFNLYRYAMHDFGYLQEDWQENHAGAGADSSLLFVAATTGVFGLMAYIKIYVCLITEAIRNSAKKLILPSLAAVFIHSFFLNSQFYPWVLAWILIIVGLGFQKRS